MYEILLSIWTHFQRYKWDFSEWGPEKRLNFFETIGLSLLVLFVLTAKGTEAEQVISTQRRRWSGAKLGKLLVFYAANTLSMRVLSLFPSESREQMQDNKTL